MKLTQTIALATVLATSLVIGCGSSTSNNPPGGSDAGADTGSIDSGTTDSGTTDSGTAQADTGAPKGPACTKSSTCASGEECCVPASASGLTGMGNCVASGSCTTGATVGCKSATDCSGGEVCCGSYSGGTSASSACAASCANGSYQLCASTTECPSGDTCAALSFMGFTLPIEICQPADAGTPPGDGGPAPDAGSSDDASADAGAADATGD